MTPNLIYIFKSSLYFVIKFEDVSSQLPALATMPAGIHISLPPTMMDFYSSGTLSQNKPFLLLVGLGHGILWQQQKHNYIQGAR